MKCPACGFDSPDEAGWCDFCKEPFRKRAPAPTPASGAPLAQTAPPPQANGVHIDLTKLDAGERIPVVAPALRYAAWAFLGIWFVWGMVLLGYYLGKKKLVEDAPPPAGMETPPPDDLPGPPSSGG